MTNGWTMIYFLGGPPRVGKSIISARIRQKHALSVVSADSLGVALHNVLSPEEAPDLYVFDKYREMPLAERIKLITNNPAELIDYVKRESRVVWRAVEAYAGRESDEGREALIEGVNVLPESVSRLQKIRHRAVFIGNQGGNHKENMKRFADENENDWIRDLGNEYISAFALFVKQMSVYIERESKKYGFEYIEMENESFENSAEEVVKSLVFGAG